MNDMDKPTPLEALRLKLALKVGENAVFDGWTMAAVDAAADQLGVDRAKARLAFPKQPTAMIDAYVEAVDAAMIKHFTPKRLEGLGITKRIRAMIWYRLELMGDAREAIRRALATLAMPQNLPLAARIGWRTADRMWRLAGDTATDYNHYTKRMILSGVYASTLLIWLDDQSEGLTETAAFLDRRLADVGKFEKWKAGLGGDPLNRPSLTRFFARLRYPAH